MRFFTTIIATVVAIGSANAACSIGGGTDPNCCWGGQNGVDACNRQGACNVGADRYNYCSYFGITPQECVGLLKHLVMLMLLMVGLMQDADCCDTRTRRGKPCPKGKNFCDEETGCPN
ncbi:hypothetical protein J1614_002734 [Plenodomus biglobosus]|nr:hypothetical protein J1614_002734 [Plenodomus biglobosus]